jgi:hypothetical protein
LCEQRSERASGTLEDYAAIDWKPWTRDPSLGPTGLYPPREATDRHGVNCRLAYALMLRSRDELIASHGELEHELVDKLMANLLETGEWLKAMAEMVESAYARLLASTSAAHLQGVKFKGT